MSLTLRQIPSPNFGGQRTAVRWVIIHSAEGALTVDALGNFFAKPSAGVSSHVGIDDHEIAQYVPYSGQAWAARSANPMSDQAELCAFAAWDRATWLSHPGMLENAAAWIADRCQARGIPAVKIGPADVAAGRPGVIGHIDITNGLHDGTHTDPGPSFPWDVVMARANEIINGTGDDMTPDESNMLTDIHRLLGAANARGVISATDPKDLPKTLEYKISDIQTALTNDLPILVGAAQAPSTTPAPSAGSKLPTEFDVPGFIKNLATAVADELDRRARDGDPKTGPVS